MTESSLHDRSTESQDTARDRRQAFRFIIRIATVLLLLLAAAYLWRGFDFLLHGDWANDLHLRWTEQHYIFRRQNPYDVHNHYSAIEQHKLVPVTARDTSVDPSVGVPSPSGYPPNAFFTQLFYLWPTWPHTRWLFAVITALGFVAISVLAYHLGRGFGTDIGLFFVAISLSISSFCTCMGNGQYTVVILGLLALYWLLVEDNRWGKAGGFNAVLGGVLCGIALLKPNISLPFMAVLLVKRRWIALLCAGLYVVLSSVAIGVYVHTSPVEMIQQMVAGGSEYAVVGYGPMQWMLLAGVPFKIVSLSLGTIVPAATIAGMFYWRFSGIEVLFAIAAVSGRLWTYHSNYDNGMIWFLLLAWALRFIRTPSLFNAIAFLCVGLSLWPPARLFDHLAPQIYQMTVWIAALIVLLGITPTAADRE